MIHVNISREVCDLSVELVFSAALTEDRGSGVALSNTDRRPLRSREGARPYNKI